METMTTTATGTTATPFCAPIQGQGFVMPALGLTFGSTGSTGTSTATADLRIDMGVNVCSRKVGAKGHVALVAYVPGSLAWSPPIC